MSQNDRKILDLGQPKFVTDGITTTYVLSHISPYTANSTHTANLAKYDEYAIQNLPLDILH
jgi:hypothetical protein